MWHGGPVMSPPLSLHSFTSHFPPSPSTATAPPLRTQLLSFRLLLSLVKLSTIRASTRSHSYSFDADLLYRVVESLALAVEPTPAPSGPTGTKKSTLPTTITTGTTDTAIDIASKSKKRRAKLEAHLGPAVVEAASRWDDVRMYLWKGIARVCDAWTTSGASTGGKVKVFFFFFLSSFHALCAPTPRPTTATATTPSPRQHPRRRPRRSSTSSRPSPRRPPQSPS
ncbi:hypothetical protein M427DRAFT_53555 [Gonapodya prolifera JEL478]|uniref:Uncharacterized protein n=1 Tax=Gonapodya prolifera (strain JEL478) TaxID=1344416 RepID=A0A139APB6_GONPJ|nr:hypothetical protein M427DRAFT_53555 [Gonapodya prolifera JEL478]|eukprot:KXS18597.1 hypothetical protein M427DRAFT_53555 [Gonapodya prolifera JEL478]